MKRRNAPALVILATASPNLVSCALSGHRLEGNDLAVVRELQSINTIQAQYKSEFGKYAATLGELGLPASGDKDGYLLIMTATPSAYVVRANPKVFGRSGRWTLYTDQSAVIRQNRSAEPANAGSSPLPEWLAKPLARTD
jgi:type IV pilus assembly protein PilA